MRYDGAMAMLALNRGGLPADSPAVRAGNGGGGDDLADEQKPDSGGGGGGGGGAGPGDEGEGGGGDQTRWVTVASFSIPTQAHLARLRLENADVDCFLLDENLVSTNWLLSAAIGGIKLQVPEDQAERAREVLGADAIPWDESEAVELAKCRVCGKGEYGPAELSWWVIGVSVLLLGIPLLFLPRRWKCEVCGAEMAE